MAAEAHSHNEVVDHAAEAQKWVQNTLDRNPQWVSLWMDTDRIGKLLHPPLVSTAMQENAPTPSLADMAKNNTAGNIDFDATMVNYDNLPDNSRANAFMSDNAFQGLKNPVDTTADDAPVETQAEETEKPKEYTVKWGDTLSSIAHKNHITVDAIMEANKQIKHRDKIFTGDKITIPGSHDAKPAEAPKKEPDKTADHAKTEVPKSGHTAQNTEPVHAKEEPMKPADTNPIDKKDTPVDVANSPEEIARVDRLLSEKKAALKALQCTIEDTNVICPDKTAIPIGKNVQSVDFDYDKDPSNPNKLKEGGKIYLVLKGFDNTQQKVEISRGKNADTNQTA